MLYRLAAALLVCTAVGTIEAQAREDVPPQRLDTLRLASLPSYRHFRDCTPDLPADQPCRLTDAPSLAEVERRLGERSAFAWDGGDRWIVAYRASSDSVTAVDVMGGIQLPLSRFSETNLWALGLRLPGADSAVMSLSFLLNKGDAFLTDEDALTEWRGPRAPESPLEADTIAGTLREDSLWSDALQAWRRVTVYLPPGHDRHERIPVVYLADGRNVRSYARVVDPLVAAGGVPPVALVGIWVSDGQVDPEEPPGPANDLRTIEYHRQIASIPGADSAFAAERYRGHMEFFTEEARKWAEDTLFVRMDRQGRAVHGNSSGGAYALTLGRERPDLYGMVIANSTGGPSVLNPPVGGWEQAARHHLSVGLLEVPSVVKHLTELSDSLAVYGIPHAVDVHPSGHDYLVWKESLPNALTWWIGTPERER